MKKKIWIIFCSGLIVVTGLISYAFISTWGKTDLDVKIHINEALVQQSTFGESPTFAIWLEQPESHEIRAVYVTRRAAEGDWEGKSEVPVALPRWFEIQKNSTKATSANNDIDGYTGATPKPGYFTTRINVEPGSKWICWIEVNLAADYNYFYKASNNEDSETDKFLSGQPTILYKAEISGVMGAVVKPEVIGMTILGAADGKVIQPLQGITTATQIFDEISITVVKQKPRIINKKIFNWGS